MSGGRLTEHQLRMADVPFGAELLGPARPHAAGAADAGGGWEATLRAWPVVKKNNVFILPAGCAPVSWCAGLDGRTEFGRRGGSWPLEECCCLRVVGQGR
jgi:hypothetical protein